MKKLLLFFFVSTAFLVAQAKEPASTTRVNTAPGFIENVGQIKNQSGRVRRDIDFKLENAYLTTFVGDASLHYQWIRYTLPPKEEGHSFATQQKTIPYTTYRLDVKLLNANTNASVIKEQPLNYYQNYYIADKDIKARAYAKITYQNIYPGIDWVIYTDASESGKNKMKYDFVVRPGGDPSQIKLQYNGAATSGINKDGSFTAGTPFGSYTDGAPVSYSMESQTTSLKTNIPTNYVFKDNILSFEIAPYQGTLVIDPAVEWSTYFGGAGFDLGTNMQCDNAGNVYLVGHTFFSSNIATAGAYQTSNAGDFDVFLSKFNAQGELLWSTYYGGEGMDYAFGLASDQVNHLYISGVTRSLTGIATPGSPQTTQSGGDIDFYISKFNTDGSLVWGRYFGTSGSEYGGLCAANRFGQIHFAGYSDGNDSIAMNAFQSNNSGGVYDAVFAQFDSSGHEQWGTFYGGDSVETADGIAYDKNGFVYFAGVTNSPDNIASSGAYQSTIGGSFDAYLVKFDTLGQRQWGTYYGGPDAESTIDPPVLVFNQCNVISTTQNGYIHLVGVSYSPTGIATPGAYQDTLNGVADAFMAKFDDSGNRIWGTYFGGEGFDQSGGVVTDYTGNTYLTGFTESYSGMATPDAYQLNNNGMQDAYLAKFDTGGQLLYSTFFGGTNIDEAISVAIDNEGNTFIAGGTQSATNIATPGSYLTIYGGGIAVFLTKFCTANPLGGIVAPDSVCAQEPIIVSVTPIPGATGYIWTLPSGWQGSSDSNSIEVTPNDQSGTVSVKIVKCDTTSAIVKDIYVYPNPEVTILQDGWVLSTQDPYQSYQWLLDQQAIPGATNASYTATQAGMYQVVVNTEYNCTDTSAAYNLTNVGVNDPALTNTIQIYPNPTDGKVFVKSPVQLNLYIWSIDGRLLSEAHQTTTIDLSNLSEGQYILQLFDSKNSFIKAEKVNIHKKQ